MKKEVSDALFGARIFYTVFHISGYIVLIKYNNPLKENFLEKNNLSYFLITFFLTVISCYLFWNCG